MTPEFWSNRRVLITGHTGFKGAWLSAWLASLGAKVTGLSLAPEGPINLWTLLDMGNEIRSVTGDINDPKALSKALEHNPEVIFHLAAQSLVIRSFARPVETFMTNVVGIASLLQAISYVPSARAIIIATSDKCYENLEGDKPFREGDRFGGDDPYSASKGCAEIVAASMRRSYFAPHADRGHPAGVATVRAGNVIGGGDWSNDRLVPDIMRGCLGSEGEVVLRAPYSIRPWQHVLEPLHGYIMLAERLFHQPHNFADGYNFGPRRNDERTTIEVAQEFVSALGRGRIVCRTAPDAPKEAKVLRLDASFAQSRLGWRPVMDFKAAVAKTASWYLDWHDGKVVAEITRVQTDEYMAITTREGVI